MSHLKRQFNLSILQRPLLPAESLEGEEGANDDQGEEERAVGHRLLARHQGVLHPAPGVQLGVRPAVHIGGQL